MKLRVDESLRGVEAGERGLLTYLAENAQDIALISTVLDQTDLAVSVHQRIFCAIQELSIDSRGNSIGDVKEILISRGDQEAATYLSNLASAERPQHWSEALALSVHLVLLGALRRAVEDEAYPVEENLW